MITTHTIERGLAFVLLAILALLVLFALTGCNSDYASPFDKPDETAQPVACAPSAPCQQ